MYCHYCGTKNEEDAAFCAKCGKRLAGAVEGPGPAPTLPPLPPEPVRVSNYLAPAILVTILCCWPFGIPAIVYASQANQKAATGDIAGAKTAASTALTWCWVAFGTGFVFGVIYIIANIAMIAAGISAGF